jgi:hypothetical protein
MYLKRCEIGILSTSLKFDLSEFLKSFSFIEKWAFILHDRYAPVPHFHIYLDFGNRTVTDNFVAMLFGIDVNLVTNITCSECSILKYLIHEYNRSSSYYYPISSIIANFDVEKVLLNNK